MVEADVLCDHLALIDHGEIVVTGSPSEKRRISRLSVIEMQLRSLSPDLLNRLRVYLESAICGPHPTACCTIS
jgi:ABC-type multidrug transport system ATPase subunit